LKKRLLLFFLLGHDKNHSIIWCSNHDPLQTWKSYGEFIPIEHAEVLKENLIYFVWQK